MNVTSVALVAKATSTMRLHGAPRYIILKERRILYMNFADLVSAIQSVWSMPFPFSSTLDLTIGQLIAWTTVLGVAISFGRGLIRG